MGLSQGNQGQSAKNGKELSYRLENGTETHKNVEIKPREKWGNKAEFLLSCIGLAVGIGNVWRFPYLAYQNGGGAFLLAYAILLVLVGKPIFFMELAIGQFVGAGPFGAMKCFPLAKGVGIAIVVMCLLVCIYYNVIMAYALYYAGLSLRREVPWKECSEWWGADETCYINHGRQEDCDDKTMASILDGNNISAYSNFEESNENISTVIMNNTSIILQKLCLSVGSNTSIKYQPASEQFWERFVLQLTDGIEYPGVLKWDLTLTLFVCWVMVCLGIIKGIKSSGKVVYFTATFPYVVLITLVICGCTLEGAVDGLKYFFIPKWENLLEIRVWRAAAEQMVYSMTLGSGCLIMISSYNDFRNEIYKDALLIGILDFMTSIMAGVVIMSVLGNLSHQMGVDISKVAKGGQGLAFVTYPDALARLPLSSLWSALFFFMLFTLAIDSQFCQLETYLTTIFDLYPHLRPKKALITIMSCSVLFLAGLPCVTQGGQYVLNLMDVYAGGYACLFVVTGEVIAIMWGYGADRFANDIEFMLGRRPGLYWIICWKYVSPVVLSFVLIYGMVIYKPIKYDTYSYPTWAEAVGWVLMLASVIQIPIWGLAQLWSLHKSGQSFLQPHPDWGPSNPEIRTEYYLENLKSIDDEDNDPVKDGVVNIAMDSLQKEKEDR